MSARLEQLRFGLELLREMYARTGNASTLATIQRVEFEIRCLTGPGIPCS